MYDVRTKFASYMNGLTSGFENHQVHKEKIEIEIFDLLFMIFSFCFDLRVSQRPKFKKLYFLRKLKLMNF